MWESNVEEADFGGFNRIDLARDEGFHGLHLGWRWWTFGYLKKQKHLWIVTSVSFQFPLHAHIVGKQPHVTLEVT